MALDHKWLLASSPAARRELVEQESKSVKIPSSTNVDEELIDSYRLGRVFMSFIKEYIMELVKEDAEDSVLSQTKLEEGIKEEIGVFLPQAVEALNQLILSREDLQKSGKNLYELSGARRLSLANKATRTLSTTMGPLWERIANISPYCISPDIEFGIKIKGIDIILMNRNSRDIQFAQLKTQQSTLTGSQRDRSVKELLLHENPIFCASFNTKSNWTFKHDSIPRLEGEEFWDRIGIQYEVVLDNVKQMIMNLETEYVKILGQI